MDIKDDAGKRKYTGLCRLMLAVCTLSHGNADPERGFSTNKHILKVHGTSLGETVLEGIRLVKDFISLAKGVKNIDVTKGMMISCKEARARYHEELRLRKEARERETQLKKELENTNAKEHEEKMLKNNIQKDLEVIESGMNIADTLLKEGQKQLEELTTKNKVDMVKLVGANSKISTGMKRKTALEKERNLLQNKLMKMH